MKKFITGLIYCVVFWYIISFICGVDFGDNRVIPYPHVVIWLGLTKLSDLKGDILISLYRLTAGLFIALVIGVLIGIALGLKENLHKIVSPLVASLHPVPKGALTPMFIAIFGIGELSKILIVTAIAIFPIIINVRDAIMNLDQHYFISAKMLNMDKKTFYRKVIFPSILPEILTTTKIAIGTGIAVLYLSESMSSNSGLGYVISTNNGVNKEMMFVGIMYLSLLGYILVSIIEGLEKKYLKWR